MQPIQPQADLAYAAGVQMSVGRTYPSRQNDVENTLFQRQVPRCSNVGN